MAPIELTTAPTRQRGRRAGLLWPLGFALLVTCDVVTHPGTLPTVQLLWTGDTVAVVGTTITVELDVLAGNVGVDQPRFDVQSLDPDKIQVINGGAALQILERDTGRVRVRLLGSQFGDSPPSVEVPIRGIVASVRLDRSTVTFSSINDTVRLAVEGLDSDGNVVASANEADKADTLFSSDPSVASVTRTGLVQAVGNGSAQIRAVVDNDTAVLAVTVDQVLASFRFSPNQVFLRAINDSATIVPTGRDAGGTDMPAARVPPITWSSGDEGVVRVSATGVVTAVNNGTTFARVRSGSVDTTVTATVDQFAASVSIDSTVVNLRSVGETRTLTARALDGRGVAVGDASPLWRSTNAAVADVQTITATSTQVIVAKQTGVALVVATIDTVADSVTVNVSNVPASISITPVLDSVLSLGDTKDFTPTVLNALGGPPDPFTVSWRTLDTAVARPDAVQPGRIVAVGLGTTLVIATVTGTTVSDTSTLRVLNKAVSVSIDSATATLASIGDTIIPSVQIRNALGASIADRSSVEWLSTNEGAATRTSDGIVVAVGRGATFIKAFVAESPVQRDSILVTVTNAPASVVLDRTLDTLNAPGRTLAYDAQVFNARNARVPSDEDTLRWRSTNTAVATINAAGVATAVAVGETRIIGEVGGAAGLRADTATLVVTNVPDSIAVTPDPLTLTALGESQTLTATVRNQLQGVIAGFTAAWQALDTTIATVDASGLVTARGIGTTQVIGSIPGMARADTATVVVQNLADQVDIDSTSVTLASVQDEVTPGAVIRNKLGGLVGRNAVNWSSDDSTIASVSALGVITARRAGTTTVRATVPTNAARTDSITVVVTNAPQVLALNRELDTLTAPTRTLQYVAEVRNSRGALITDAVVAFRSTNVTVASVTGAGGLATANAVGTVLIIAEVTGAAGLRADTATLVVTNVAASLTVSPTSADIASIGGTRQLAATAINDVGGEVAGITFDWSSSDTTIATVDQTGLVSGVRVGSVQITAQLVISPTRILSASATVSVTNAPDTVNIIQTSVTLASVNDSFDLDVRLRNALGDSLPDGAAAWSSDDALIATVTSDGVVIAAARGVTKVRARNPLDASRRDSVTVTVTNAPDSIDVNRTVDSLPSLNRTISYSATVYNARRAVIAGEAVTWTSRNGSIATVDAAGVARSVGPGSVYIVGTAGAVSDSALLVVSNLAADVSITPGALSLTSVAETFQLAATARNELGNVITGATVAWRSTNTAVATVSAEGLVTAVTVGSADVFATVDAESTSIAVTVTNHPATIAITSGDITLASVGDQVTPAATIQNGLGANLARGSATWTTSNANVASVSSDGVVTATGAGTATITATSPGNALVTSSITVTVTNAPASVTLSDDTDTLTALGRTRTYLALVRNAAGNLISTTVTWTSSNSAIVSVGADGTVTAVATGGPVLIIATAGTVADTVSVRVTNHAVSVKVSPESTTVLDLGGTVQLAVTALNDLNNPLPAAAIIWSSLEGTVASVNATGLVTASLINTGTARIVATDSSTGLADTSFVTVANAPTTVLITSGDITLASVGDTVTPAADIRNAAGDVLARTAVTWTTSASQVATVSPAGIVTATGAGTATIAATSPYDPLETSSIAVTVTNAPADLVLNASAVSLSAIGRTFTLSGVVNNARGDPISGSTINWSSDAAGVASVSAEGIVTAVAPGAATITGTVAGTAPAITETAAVTVTNFPASLSVSPSSATITAVGATATLTPTARNDLGNAIAGEGVAWSTSDATVATVSAAGVVTAAGVGTASITAKVRGATLASADSISAAVPLTVRDDLVFIDLTPDLPDSVTLTILSTSLTAAVLRNGLTPTPADLPRNSALWSTTNEGVATVNDTGLVTAKGAGVAFIRAVSPANSTIRDSVKVRVTAPPATVSIDQANQTLTAVGRTLQLSATVRDSAGNLLTDAVTWASANAAVVSVGATTGLATAVAVGGPIEITATTANGKADTVQLSVTNDPASISLSPSSVTITSLAAAQAVTATALNNLGNPIAGTSFTWSSSNTGVATVVTPSTDGTTITAAGVGSANVTATVSGLSSTIPVTVRNDVDSVLFITPDTTFTNLEDTATIAVTILNGLDAPIAQRDAVTWASTNSSVASVSTTGIVTAHAVGTAMISATSPADPVHTDTITVTVQNVPASVTLSSTGDTLIAVGQQLTYAATVRNARNAVISDATVTWTSQNAAQVSVSSEGTVTGLTFTADTVQIYAASGSQADTLTVLVTNPDTVHVNKDASGTTRLGTRRYPFIKIQDAINLADPGDIVLIRRAATNYSEALTTNGSVTLRGAILSTGAPCNPTRCPGADSVPTIAHDFGAAGITPSNNTTLTLRHVAIRHSVDGPAVDANGASVDADSIYVNPTGVATPTGRGILVRNATAPVIRRTSITNVKGYGVRLETVTGGTLDALTVNTVDSVADGRSGVHLVNSSGVTVSNSGFTQTGATMDGIRLSNSRTATLTSNTFTNGRYSVRADSSNLTTSGNVSTGAVTGFLLASADTVGSTTDSVASSSAACVSISGAAQVASFTTPRLGACATTTGTDAVSVDDGGAKTAQLTIADGRFTNMNRRVVNFVSGGLLQITGGTLVGDSTTGAAQAEAVITAASADSVIITNSIITDFRRRIAVDLAASELARVDSNLITRDRVGVQMGSVPAGVLMQRNDIWNLTDSLAAVDLPNQDTLLFNFWGDTLGPRRDAVYGSAGDSVIFTAGPTDFDAIVKTPLFPGAGADSLAALRGDGDSDADSLALSVRVLDATGKPVSGVTVSFESSDNGDDFVPGGGPNNTVDVITDAAGIARAIIRFDNTTGLRTVTITAAGLGGSPLTYTVTKI